MIDPDGLQIQESNLPSIIKVVQVPDFECEVYNLEDDKDYEHFVKDVEKEVRKSFEYRAFIKYLRDNMGMNKCAFLKGVSNEETFDIKIEIHHYPFSLRDIVEIVIRKRSYYSESTYLQEVAKEVMILHYKLMIGLIPLSETVHEIAHSGRLFIPVDRVVGRYNLFLDFYQPFCNPEQLETLKRIERYTEEQANLYNTTILEQNRLTYNVEDNRFALPSPQQLQSKMIDRIETIKANNFLLPVAEDIEVLPKKEEPFCPIEFDMSLIKK